jgi:hypothetical protein
MSTGPDNVRRPEITGSANVRTRQYKDQLAALPREVRDLAELAFQKFLENPLHPALRNHPLDDTRKGRHRTGSRSVSVSMKYRAIYVVDGDTNVWYWIGSHADYDTFTGGK